MIFLTRDGDQQNKVEAWLLEMITCDGLKPPTSHVFCEHYNCWRFFSRLTLPLRNWGFSLTDYHCYDESFDFQDILWRIWSTDDANCPLKHEFPIHYTCTALTLQCLRIITVCQYLLRFTHFFGDACPMVQLFPRNERGRGGLHTFILGRVAWAWGDQWSAWPGRGNRKWIADGLHQWGYPKKWMVFFRENMGKVQLYITGWELVETPIWWWIRQKRWWEFSAIVSPV